MKYYYALLFLCMATICQANFGIQTTSGPKANNICVYSSDPTKYVPKCFLCSLEVYLNALGACVNGTSMPKNITYSSALCLEKNCEINYPTAKPAAALSSLDKGSVLDLLGRIFSLRPPAEKTKRSVENNNIDSSSDETKPRTGLSKSDWTIMEEVETFASETDFTELDYNEVNPEIF